MEVRIRLIRVNFVTGSEKGEAMRILLINLCLRYESPRYILPVGLGYIATAMKAAGYEFDVLDLDKLRPSESALVEMLENKIYDVYLMGCIVTGYRHVKSITSMIRRINPEALIVVGNSVASSVPEILLTYTDSDIAIFSEGDETVIDILRASESGDFSGVPGIAYSLNEKVCYTPKRPTIKDINSLPLIDWEIFDTSFYISRSGVLANEPCPISFADRVCMSIPLSRGCPFKCSFCYNVFIDDRYRFRTPESIVGEIRLRQKQYGLNYINFWDDLSFPTAAHCEEFVDAVLSEGLKFYWNATVRGDLLYKPEHRLLADKMKRAGCVGLTYSLEHINPDILKAMNKKLDIQKFLAQKRILDDAGMVTWTNLVIGYPQETVETINQAIDFCYEHNIYPSSGYLLPLPGAPIYDYALKYGFIKDEEAWLLKVGDRQDLHINMTTMDDQLMISTLENGLDRINKKMGIGLDKNSLIKTGVKRDVANKLSRAHQVS